MVAFLFPFTCEIEKDNRSDNGKISNRKNCRPTTLNWNAPYQLMKCSGNFDPKSHWNQKKTCNMRLNDVTLFRCMLKLPNADKVKVLKLIDSTWRPEDAADSRQSSRQNVCIRRFAFSHEQHEKIDTSNPAVKWIKRSMILQSSIFAHWAFQRFIDNCEKYSSAL